MTDKLEYLKTFVADHESKIIVLVDKHTYAHCYPLLGINLPYILIPYGENYKNLNTCELIWKKLVELSATRETILLCLGGGVLTDTGAFAGSCYQRGMRVVLAPTSLLAMVDASVGGKNGINFLGFKNYVGLFSKPNKLFICPEFLNTLPHDEMINGSVEMLKHGLIANRAHFDEVKDLFFSDSNVVSPALIHDSIQIKEDLVAHDFRDNNFRKRLNFGHTIGHAIEAYSIHTQDENEHLSHGLSVALGIVVESYISTKVAGLSDADLNEISSVLMSVIHPNIQHVPSLKELLPYLKRDKKNQDHHINFTLLSAIGVSNHDYFVEESMIESGLAYLINQL